MYYRLEIWKTDSNFLVVDTERKLCLPAPTEKRARAYIDALEKGRGSLSRRLEVDVADCTVVETFHRDGSYAEAQEEKKQKRIEANRAMDEVFSKPPPAWLVNMVNRAVSR